eukprot:gene18850-23842_t
MVLNKYPHRVGELTDALDKKGRRCLDIASPNCKQLMLKKLYLHGRYEVNPGPPEHRSATSAVFFAVDHEDSVHVRTHDEDTEDHNADRSEDKKD